MRYFASALVVAVLSFGWYKLWVEPRTEFLMEVAACMGPDSSQEAYVRCAERVSKERE